MSFRGRFFDLTVLVVSSAALYACQRTASEPSAASSAVPAAPAPATTEAKPATPHAGPAAGSRPGGELGVTWTDPAAWQRVAPKSSMRAAQYTVPPAAGDSEPAEVTVFHFGPQMGGGVEENITRWIGQFSGVPADGVKRNVKNSNGLTHTMVQVESGTFQGMSPMMGGASEPKTGYGMLGAVTETPSGMYFFKMTGPSKTVAANQAAFDQLVESIKTK